MKAIIRVIEEKGGPGSGHHGHAGRQGKRGGSLPGTGGGLTRITKEQLSSGDEFILLEDSYRYGAGYKNL